MSFIHRFEQGADKALLLLHGTGGDENSLLEWGRALAPGYSLLSPRGKSLDEGYPRFFRRFAEGRFDEQDIQTRAKELAEWVADMRQEHGLNHVTALGYSNGANIASALMLLHPGSVENAILLRGMTPLVLTQPPSLDGQVLMLNGAEDPIVPKQDAEGLAKTLAVAGAKVSLQFLPTGHSLSKQDFDTAKNWLAQISPGQSSPTAT